MIRRLFLFGGNPSQYEAQAEFVTAAGGSAADVALLLVRRPGWEAYLPRYLDPWMLSGVRAYHVVIPDEDGLLDESKLDACLRHATGIFIGGGHTATYQSYYAQGQVAELIRERYREGVPVGGSSAGALLFPEICRMSPWDTDSGTAQSRPGLGLLAGCLISVHFVSRQDEQNIVEAMIETRIPSAWGIDDSACAVFRDEVFSHAIGAGVYHLQFNGTFDRHTCSLMG